MSLGDCVVRKVLGDSRGCFTLAMTSLFVCHCEKSIFEAISRVPVLYLGVLKVSITVVARKGLPILG